MRKKFLVQGFLFAFGEGVYISLVAFFMMNGENIFGKMPSIWGFVTILMLFVISAAVSGALILGKPVLLYLDGKKKEALELFGFTLGWLLIFLVVLLVAIATLGQH